MARIVGPARGVTLVVKAACQTRLIAGVHWSKAMVLEQGMGLQMKGPLSPCVYNARANFKEPLKDKSMTDEGGVEALLEDCEASLEAGEEREAFQKLRAIFRDREGLREDESWLWALSILQNFAEARGLDKLATKVAELSMDRSDELLHYELAYEFYEQRLHDLAVYFLSEVNDRSPGQARIVQELATNYEALFAFSKARDLLAENPDLIESVPMSAYLYGFHSVMCAEVEDARGVLPRLFKVEDATTQYLAKALEGMVARYDALKGACSLSRQDLRGWHFVLNGSILTTLSPFGFQAGMNGRYAYIQDSYQQCRESLQALRLVLETADLEIDQVLHFSDKSSQVLATALSEELGKPLKSWTELDEGGDSRALLVSYDLNDLSSREEFDFISEHRRGLVLWSHANNWVEPFPFASDMAGYLYQHNVNPWDGGGFSIRPGSQELETEPADGRSASDIARQVLQAELGEEGDDEFPSREQRDAELLALVQAARAMDSEHGPNWQRSAGKRLRERAGSPVPSNRFA